MDEDELGGVIAWLYYKNPWYYSTINHFSGLGARTLIYEKTHMIFKHTLEYCTGRADRRKISSSLPCWSKIENDE